MIYHPPSNNIEVNCSSKCTSIFIYIFCMPKQKDNLTIRHSFTKSIRGPNILLYNVF
jgi:hypothetical protein